MIDRDLITRCLAGDPSAERELYDAHVDRIYRLAYRMAGDGDLAEDFTQETFIRAFERLEQFRGESSLATWLHSIAVSVALNGMRKVQRIRLRTTDLSDMPTLASEARDLPQLGEEVVDLAAQPVDVAPARHGSQRTAAPCSRRPPPRLSHSLQSRHPHETPAAYVRLMRILVAGSGLLTLLVLLIHP